jgi:lysophospholipase L1-like esterase
VRDWTFFADDVEQFNKETLRVCKKMKVKINDLHEVINRQGTDAHLERNGYELNAKGLNLIAQAIATEVQKVI